MKLFTGRHNRPMNTLKQLAVTILATLLTTGALHAQQERFEIELRGTSWTTNESGGLVRSTINQNTYIRECIRDLGLTNRPRMMLVYHAGADFNGDYIEVAHRNSGETRCLKLRLLFPSELSNNDGSHIRKKINVFTPAGNDHVGEGFVTRKVTRNGRVRLTGEILFELPADGVNGRRLVRATFNSVRHLN